MTVVEWCRAGGQGQVLASWQEPKTWEQKAQLYLLLYRYIIILAKMQKTVFFYFFYDAMASHLQQDLSKIS